MLRTRRKRPLGGLMLVLAVALGLGLTAGPARALEVKQVLWGFDGRAVPERINLLSVLVDNQAAKPYNGDATVYQGDTGGKRYGALIAQPIYLAPFASRWVQFYVYVTGEQEDWTLEMARRKHQLDAPDLAAPARVYLRDPDALSMRPVEAKAFPEDLFPASVSATDGLDSVLMDHAPKWEPLRRQAFVDWLRRGGTVHIFAGPDGRYPAFTSELVVLNQDAPRQRVGAGLVVRHPAEEQRPGEKALTAAGFPPLSLERAQNRYYMDSTDTGILQSLTRLVQPKHSWPLIYLTLVVYFVLVVPVNFLLSRKARSFRAPLAFFLICVLGATVLLTFIGRRGYGETQKEISVAVARQLDEGVYDVTHWTNVFMTHGGQYPLAYQGDYGIYSSGQSMETVNAIAVNGVGGRLMADIPLYSSRPFLHRGKMRGPDLGVRLLEAQAGNRLEGLACSVGPQFPARPVEMWAFYQGRFYALAHTGDRLTQMDRSGQDRATFLSEEQVRVQDRYMGYQPYRQNASPAPEDVLPKMVRPLIAHCLGGTPETPYSFNNAAAPDNRIQLFIFAEGSGALAQGPAGGTQTGYVLYHLDLFP